jgi:hypothetical protein
MTEENTFIFLNLELDRNDLALHRLKCFLGYRLGLLSRMKNALRCMCLFQQFRNPNFTALHSSIQNSKRNHIKECLGHIRIRASRKYVSERLMEINTG